MVWENIYSFWKLHAEKMYEYYTKIHIIVYYLNKVLSNSILLYVYFVCILEFFYKKRKNEVIFSHKKNI